MKYFLLCLKEKKKNYQLAKYKKADTTTKWKILQIFSKNLESKRSKIPQIIKFKMLYEKDKY